MARGLTARQLAFARLVSQGVPKTEALLTAYPGGRRSRVTARVEACRLSQKPRVSAEIERLVASRFPEAFNYARLMEQAVGTMMTLSETGSGWTRLRAAKWLHDYASAREALEAEPLGPLAMEQQSDAQAEVEAARTTPREVAEVPALPLIPPRDQDPASQPVQPDAREEERAMYEWHQLPGFFGRPRFVRVRVR